MEKEPCDWGPCKKMVDPAKLVRKVEHVGRSTKQSFFCSEDCANEHTLNKLRNSGM